MLLYSFPHPELGSELESETYRGAGTSTAKYWQGLTSLTRRLGAPAANRAISWRWLPGYFIYLFIYSPRRHAARRLRPFRKTEGSTSYQYLGRYRFPGLWVAIEALMSMLLLDVFDRPRARDALASRGSRADTTTL